MKAWYSLWVCYVGRNTDLEALIHAAREACPRIVDLAKHYISDRMPIRQ